MARKYIRDNRGRFASGGGGATARGGRLKTAAGNKRATQTMKARGQGGAGVMKGAVQRDAGAMAKVGKAAAPKAGTVPLNQVKRYNALDKARRRQKETYSREMSRVTGSTDRRRADAAMPKASLADRKTRRIEATMRRMSNSPNSPNVPVLPRARKVGEAITGPMSIYGRKTPRMQAPAIANTISKPKAKLSAPAPATGSRTKGQAKAAQRNRREQVLDRGRTGMSKNPRIRKVQTGMSQLSLMGKAKPLVKFKPASKRK